MTFRELSAIGWTDYSGGPANFVIGCTPASEGCAHCYAKAWAAKYGRSFAPAVYPGKLADLRGARFDGPTKRGGGRPMVFVCDLGDLFHEAVPDDFIRAALAVMVARSDVDWQVLTKRPERAAAVLTDALPGNVWLGVTAETQRRADERIPVLVNIPAAVRFVSVEPMLEPVTLPLTRVSWVICGGESGPDRRAFDKAWAAALKAECAAAGVPFFFKQSGAAQPGRDCLIDGIEAKAWP